MKLFNDIKYLREDYRVNENLVEFETAQLHAEIKQVEDSSVVALVGGYGTGKSTALYNIELSDDKKISRWFHFDAWRYPERKGLWDGLIIELAREIGIEKKAVRKIDGNKSVIGRWGGIVGEFFSQFGDSLPKVEVDKIALDPNVTEKAAKLSEKASSLFGKSPAKRAYELERILADVLLSIDEQIIYIVAEDVDRSGPDGINFLETLNYFIKNNEQINKSNKKIVVIAPIADNAYHDHRESLYKCVDIFIEHKPIVKSSDAFVKHIFTEDALGGESLPRLRDISDFINTLLETRNFKINIRKLKLILRHTNQRYRELVSSKENVDWRAIFVVEVMRVAQNRNNDSPLFESAKSAGVISEGTIFSALLRTIYRPQERIYQYKYANDRSKENRIINPQSMSYTFYNYTNQAETSVWEGYAADLYSAKGYIADFYIR